MKRIANGIRARPDETNSRPIVESHYKINKKQGVVMDNNKKPFINEDDIYDIAAIAMMGGLFAAASYQARSLHSPRLSEEKRQQLRNKHKDDKK